MASKVESARKRYEAEISDPSTPPLQKTIARQMLANMQTMESQLKKQQIAYEKAQTKAVSSKKPNPEYWRDRLNSPDPRERKLAEFVTSRQTQKGPIPRPEPSSIQGKEGVTARPGTDTRRVASPSLKGGGVAARAPTREEREEALPSPMQGFEHEERDPRRMSFAAPAGKTFQDMDPDPPTIDNPLEAEMARRERLLYNESLISRQEGDRVRYQTMADGVAQLRLAISAPPERVYRGKPPGSPSMTPRRVKVKSFKPLGPPRRVRRK